jgi:hypothetical protein
MILASPGRAAAARSTAGSPAWWGLDQLAHEVTPMLPVNLGQRGPGPLDVGGVTSPTALRRPFAGLTLTLFSCTARTQQHSPL